MGNRLESDLEYQRQFQAQRRQEAAQRALLASQQRAEMAGQKQEQWMQQQYQQAAPVQNYNEMMQMTPEKMAAYRQQQNGTTMQQGPGISNGQMDGQQAIANLLRMLGLM